jgi:V8-like Glu-specific endopeptidase
MVGSPEMNKWRKSGSRKEGLNVWLWVLTAAKLSVSSRLIATFGVRGGGTLRHDYDNTDVGIPMFPASQTMHPFCRLRAGGFHHLQRWSPFIFEARHSWNLLTGAKIVFLRLGGDRVVTQDGFNSQYSDVGPPGYQWRWLNNPLLPPYDMICAIKRHRGQEKPFHLGTGLLIDREIILTAAHVVNAGYAKVNRGTYWEAPGTDLFAVRGLNKGVKLSSKWMKKVAFIVEAPKVGSSEDIAVVLLQGALAPGQTALTPTAVSDTFSGQVQIAGYPELAGTNPPATGDDIVIGTGIGAVYNANRELIAYRADTARGHSGSPIIAGGDLVGIHVADRHLMDGLRNGGVRLTNQRLQWIMAIVSLLKQ